MKPVLLCILDGVGMRKKKYGNAFFQAKTPHFDYLWKTYPHNYLEASGSFVGLPDGQMGNSEVGHLNIGAGRVVYQPLQLINEKIKDKSFFENKTLLNVIEHVKNNHSRLQIFGLLSDGGIHSHIDHLMAFIDLCKKENMKDVYFHIFTDGRDTLTNVAVHYLDQLQKKIDETGIGKIATISGRYYAMDRDNRYDRIEKAYNAIVNGKGEKFSNYKEVIAHNYENGITDEFIVPAVLDKEGCIKKGDGLFVFNYRPDRLRELFAAFTNPKFSGFKCKKISNLKLVTMMSVSDEVIYEPAFALEQLDNTLGEYVSKKGLKQLRIAETEKYAHVTYFFDGGEEKQLDGCDRILIPSPKVTTYDLSPDMSANEITDTLLAKLDEDHYDLIILNFANGDMLGHTGNMEATIQGIETVDVCLGKLYEKIKEKNGVLIVTADHGNCEIMLDQNHNKVTTHTTSLVPLIVTKKGISLQKGCLSDIAPTILSLLDLEIPSEMTGNNLIKTSRKNHRKSNIFFLISYLFLFSLIFYYGYRFVHFYQLNHVDPAQSMILLHNQVVADSPLVMSGDGLYFDQSRYVYKGNVDNNYVYYSGYYFRIVRINTDGTIVLITDKNVTSMVWNYPNNDYKTSYIRDWLNDNGLEHTGIFYNSLEDPDTYIQATSYCIDAVEQETATCNHTVMDKVGLLTLQEYKDALGNNSYLNNGTYWWTSNASLDGHIWYVFPEGGISEKSNVYNAYYAYGVRPVITLKSNVVFQSGNGTKEDPYRIAPAENHLHVGSYVSFSNSIWKVMSMNDEEIRLLLNDIITVDGEPLTQIYSNQSNLYNPNEIGSLAYYLNHNYYNQLQNKDLLIDALWYNGTYGDSYNYKDVYSSSVSAKVGLVNVGTIYDYGNHSFVTMTGMNDDLMYIVSEQGMLVTTDIQSPFMIKPMIAVTASVQIIGGTGTENDPYIIG